MKINTRTRLLTMLLIVSFLLMIQVITNSFKINELLRKLRIQNGVKATRRRAEPSVIDPNDSKSQKGEMKHGNQSRPNKDGNAFLNENLKSVTIGSFKTDIKKINPSNKAPQTTKTREHKTNGILKRATTASPKTDAGKVHPSKQVPTATKAQDTTGILKRIRTGNFKTDDLNVHLTTKVLQTTSQEHKTKHLNIYPKNDGTYLGYGETNCKRARDKNVFARLFEHWVNLAKKEKIEYFLSCGTLLGSLRNGDIIPHDSDIDVLVKQSDFLKIKKNSTTKPFSPYGKEIHVYVNKDFDKPFNKRRRFKCSGQVVSAQIDHCSFQELLGRVVSEGHYMDIYDYSQNGDIISDLSDGGRTFHVNDIFPLRKCHLMTFETFCPNNPVKVLNTFYGNNLDPQYICKNGTWVRKH